MAQSIFVQAADLRARYHVSDMWIWRRVKDTASGFPQPVYINRRRFWRLAEIEAWEQAQSTEAA